MRRPGTLTFAIVAVSLTALAVANGAGPANPNASRTATYANGSTVALTTEAAPLPSSLGRR